MMRILLLHCIFLLPLCGAVEAHAQARTAEAPNEGVTRLFRALEFKFESGQDTIHPSSIPALDAVADVLERYPALRLEIAGHTDASGSAASNLRLSEARAASIRAYLVARYGIHPDRLSVAGYGESMPIASNATASGRALNRRVEFRVLQPAEQTAEPAAADRPAVNADSLREAIRRQVEEAVQSALGEPESERVSELEAQLQQRLEEIERLVAEQEAESSLASPIPPPSARGFGLLPFTGFYLRHDLPVLLGLRADFPTTIFGSPRLQPEVALGFRPDERATLFGANLVFPVSLGPRSSLTPFLGGGVGFQNLDGWESVLNLLIGTEYQLNFGILFFEFMTEDFFDFNRLIVGFRQEI